jgi:hypothetical protein
LPPIRNNLAPPPPQTLDRRRQLRFASAVVSLSSWSSAGASRGGEEAARVICGRPMPCASLRSSLESHPRRRPPQRDVRCHCPLSVLLDPLFGFAASSYKSRGKSRLVSCTGVLDRLAPARPPSSAAVSGESAAGLPFTGVPGRPSPDLWSRSHLAAGSTGSIPVNRQQPRVFAKETLAFLSFAGRSPHHRGALTNRSRSLRF